MVINKKIETISRSVPRFVNIFDFIATFVICKNSNRWKWRNFFIYKVTLLYIYIYIYIYIKKKNGSFLKKLTNRGKIKLKQRQRMKFWRTLCCAFFFNILIACSYKCSCYCFHNFIMEPSLNLRYMHYDRLNGKHSIWIIKLHNLFLILWYGDGRK